MAETERKVFQLTVFSINEGEDYRFEVDLDINGVGLKVSKTKEEFLRAREEREARGRKPQRSVPRRPRQQKIEVEDRTGG